MREADPAVTARLREAVQDPRVINRYRSKLATATGSCPLIWTGAITGRGHGRFWIGLTTEGRNAVVIAHRYGYALTHGVGQLLAVEVVSHSCDNPLCQTPEHWRGRSNAENRAEWAARRHTPGSALRDLRGARGRANELRTAIRNGHDPSPVSDAGLGHDIYQDRLW
ncbi:hypothetical protein [Microlunatus sp. Y2014]|uniref:hypothetical protein n=1 Tax=Microlunatus sp. Y2014 TaxID=3418488 RepID=UPI003DA79046